MRSKIYRRNQEKVKDLRRRFLYRNNAINGRYELNPDTEDSSISIIHNRAGYGTSRWSKVTIVPEKLNNKEGHWQEYPKTKYYGSKGYYRKRNWKQQSFKEKILSELLDKEKNSD